MKKEKSKKVGIGAGVSLAAFFSVVVAFLVISAYVGEPVRDNVVVTKTLQRIQVFPVGDASLGDGATKVQYIMHYKHFEDITGTYDTNLSNSSGDCYEFYDYLDNEMTGETPYSTAFDVVIKVAVNATHGWNATASEWQLALHNATMDGITGYGFTTDVAMVEVPIANDTGGTTYTFVHYVLQDTNGGNGTGFTIGQGVNTNATFEFWAYQ